MPPGPFARVLQAESRTSPSLRNAPMSSQWRQCCRKQRWAQKPVPPQPCPTEPGTQTIWLRAVLSRPGPGALAAVPRYIAESGGKASESVPRLLSPVLSNLWDRDDTHIRFPQSLFEKALRCNRPPGILRPPVGLPGTDWKVCGRRPESHRKTLCPLVSSPFSRLLLCRNRTLPDDLRFRQIPADTSHCAEIISPAITHCFHGKTFPHPTNQAPEIPLLPMVPASLYARKLSRRKIHASGTAFSISPRFKLYQLPHLSRIMASAVTTFSMRERTLSTPGCSST